jgi:hypothetical protein
MCPEHPAHIVSFLPAHVIEVQTHRVGFTAINARVSCEVGQNLAAIHLPRHLIPFQGFLYVVGVVIAVMVPNLLAGTVTTPDLTFPKTFGFVVELLNPFDRGTARAVLPVHVCILALRIIVRVS